MHLFLSSAEDQSRHTHTSDQNVVGCWFASATHGETKPATVEAQGARIRRKIFASTGSTHNWFRVENTTHAQQRHFVHVNIRKPATRQVVDPKQGTAY